MSVYGYRRDASLAESFRWGEGLIGTCARQRSRMLVSDIPAEYPRIASALGEAAPRQILFVPILFENSLVAVMELATLGSFTELQMTLLDQLSFNVGVIMNSISASMRTQELLEEARQTAEELQRSEEELKTQQEELEASNEEMEEKTKALEEQNGRIRQQSAELEQTQRVIEEKAAELELSNRYKSEFLANMSSYVHRSTACSFCHAALRTMRREISPQSKSKRRASSTVVAWSCCPSSTTFSTCRKSKRARLR
jgi:GAF domain-containing protein